MELLESLLTSELVLVSLSDSILYICKVYVSWRRRCCLVWYLRGGLWVLLVMLDFAAFKAEASSFGRCAVPSSEASTGSTRMQHAQMQQNNKFNGTPLRTTRGSSDVVSNRQRVVNTDIIVQQNRPHDPKHDRGNQIYRRGMFLIRLGVPNSLRNTVLG